MGGMNSRTKRMEYDTQAREIVDKMSLKEKIHLMGGRTSMIRAGVEFHTIGYNHKPYPAGGNKKLGIPAMKFCDGPRGVVSLNSTCFPVTMGRGASFDTALEQRVGEAIAKEVRSCGGNLFGGVCLNIPYHPGWGRSQEVYGEDSCHMGKMGAAFVEGVQKHNVIACLKHFAFNSMENARFRVSVIADKRTEQEVFLPHFKKCIEAGAAAVMSAYNKYQGEHCGHNGYLLNDVLRNDWGFDGFVMSDFTFGIRDTAGGMNGGCDIEMMNTNHYAYKKVKKEIDEGQISEETVTKSAIRIVRTLLATKYAKDPQQYPAGLNACADHVALAREAADKSITLLKNTGQILPLDSKKVKRLVLVGDLSNEKNIGDHGSSRVRPPHVITIYESIQMLYPEIQVELIKTAKAAQSKAQISSADAVIIACGYTHGDEGEMISEKTHIGGDRKSLGLSEKDLQMIKTVGQINPNTATVLFGGNMIMMTEWYDQTPAILMAYYPGMEGGHAITDILFGKVNPSGKLPFVVPVRESDLPQVNFETNKEQVYEYYHGYRKLDKESKKAFLPYGFGLSYTRFEITDYRLAGVNREEAVFSVMVENCGSSEGGEVLQLYIGCQDSCVDRPIKVLKDFQKVYLKAGEKRKVELRVKKEDLAYYNETINGWQQEDITYIAYIGTDANEAMYHKIPYQYE